jgi:hypothetical protein
VSHLGGGDISWILGLIVAAGFYYLLHLDIARGRAALAQPQVLAGTAAR